MKILLFFFSCVLSTGLQAKNVNIYVWGGEIPNSLIQAFEKKTGIHVRVSTYDSNETLFAKLKASKKNIYDVILPSGYFVERMRKQAMLEKLDHSKLPNRKHLSTRFLNNPYDPQNAHSIPIIWGATGIFSSNPEVTALEDWETLWSPKLKRQLLLLDDAREVFSMALLALGYSPNDENPLHIQHAYTHLLQLIPNIKLFASDNVQSILIDEDARVGIAWNGDAFKAQQDNANIHFGFPKQGFVLWIDCLAIPKNPPHREEAYAFINFVLNPASARQIALEEGHAITNETAKKALPKTIRDNPILYPSDDILALSWVQEEVSEETIRLYNYYWKRLKLTL